MAITKEQIFTVADGLDATGHAATLAAVRRALGGGSFTTISEAMTEWKARKAEREAPRREAPPQPVVDLLSGLGAEVWSAALALANARLAGERAALDEARAQLEADKTEAAELADQVSAELDTLKAERATQDAKIAKLRRAAEEGDAATCKLTQNLASANARLDEVAKRADQLNAELERIGAQNAELIRTLSEMTKADRETRKPGK
jgi:DNA repair exonuclease SbcCD ATPase subunit